MIGRRGRARSCLLAAVTVLMLDVATITFHAQGDEELVVSDHDQPWRPAPEGPAPLALPAVDPPPTTTSTVVAPSVPSRTGSDGERRGGGSTTTDDEGQGSVGGDGPGGSTGDGNGDGDGPATEVPQGPTGFPLATGSAPMPDATVVADGLAAQGPAARVAQGFLHGAYPSGGSVLSNAAVARLRPTLWRLSVPAHAEIPGLDWSAFELAERSGASINVLLDDSWYSDNQIPDQLQRELCARVGAGAVVPWNSWAYYRDWLTRFVNAMVALGHVPEYWEPFNEPSGHSYNGCDRFTVERQLEVWRVSYEVITAILPDAKVIGPSIALWAPDRASAPADVLDLTTFLDDVAARGIRLGAINWHEIGEGNPHDVAEHVRAARAMLDARGLTDTEVLVNEYLSAPRSELPGWITGYVGAFEDSGVDRASRSCGGDQARLDYCFQPTLTGLLDPQGGTQVSFLTHEFYGGMVGTRVATRSADEDITAFAVRDDDAQVLRAMVGRHHGCAGRIALRCDLLGPVAPADVPFVVRAPWTTGRYRVVATRIPTTAGALTAAGLPVVLDTTVPVDGDGFLHLTLPALADGEAITVTLTPIR